MNTFLICLVISMAAHAGALSLLMRKPTGGSYAQIEIEVQYSKFEQNMNVSPNTPTHPAVASVTSSFLAAKGATPLSDVAQASESQSADSYEVFGHDIGISVSYPRLSRTLGEQGTVAISFESKKDTMRPIVLRSSGHSRLDEAALTAVQKALNAGNLPSHIFENKLPNINFIFKLTGQAL